MEPASTKAEPQTDLASFSEAEQNVPWSRIFLPFFFPALGGLLFGYDIGATSGALLSLKDPVLSGTEWYDLSVAGTGLVVSGSLTGALLGSALAFLVADPLGRRRELILASVLYASAAICTAAAPSFPIFLVGRVLFGLGIGLAMHAAPMYIAETSPAPVRGTLIAMKEGLIVSGIVLGFLSGSFFIDDIGGWREMYGVSLPIALIMGLGMAWLPPSPRWLLLRYSLLSSSSLSLSEEDACPPPPASDQSATPNTPLLPFEEPGPEALPGQAVACLLRLRGSAVSPDQAKAEVQAIMQTVQGQRQQQAQEPTLADLFSGTTAKALGIAGGLVIFQQITGQPSVLYYAATILQDAGFAAASDATKVSILLGLVKLLMTGVSVVLVDRAGRRPLLIVGISGLTLSLFVLGTVYQLHLSLPLVNVGALLLYVGAYQVSFGPISWLMVSEIFALRVRGRAQSVATLLNFGSNALVTFALPPIQEQIGQAGTFYTFASIGIVALLFVLFAVPETKGLTLEQIQELLSPEHDT